MYMVRTRTQQQEQIEQKARDAINWRKYYAQHSFRYKRAKLVKRILKKKRVLLRTLKKYQLYEFYKENTTEANKKYLKDEQDFLDALERTPLNNYVNETVSVVSNDLKEMLVGNTHSPIINPDRISVKVNVSCPDGGVEEAEDTEIDHDIVDNYEEDFDDGEEETKIDDLDVEDDMDTQPPTPPPPKKKKKKKPSFSARYTLADGLKDISNGKKLNVKTKKMEKLAQSSVVQNQGTLKRIVELLGCKEDLITCLRKIRNMKRLQYKIVDGKKVLRENKN